MKSASENVVVRPRRRVIDAQALSRASGIDEEAEPAKREPRLRVSMGAHVARNLEELETAFRRGRL